MKIDKIDNVENYVVLTYPQFTANINDIECRIFGVCYNGDGLEDVECIEEITDTNIFDELPNEIQDKIKSILLDILGDETNLTY
jgi:hypothetical protein